MSIDTIRNWHALARPAPSEDDLRVQIGCHFEEIVEMLKTIVVDSKSQNLLSDAMVSLHLLGDWLKTGQATVEIEDRKEMLDALCDQIVTAVGVGYCAGMQITEAVKRVDDSNWSKFVDGQPVKNAHGKIAKGPNYREPDFSGCI